VADEAQPDAVPELEVDIAQGDDDRHLGRAFDVAADHAEDGLLQRPVAGVEDGEVDARLVQRDADLGSGRRGGHGSPCQTQ
jgi:hypothetical protein